MATYTTTDTPPINCNSFTQYNDNPIQAMFPCGCVVNEIKPTLLLAWYQCKCGRNKFCVKAECIVWTDEEAEIQNELKHVDYMLRNKVHMMPWVRRLKMILDIALSPRRAP